MLYSEVPLRVSQLYAACGFCKARKIKCDGTYPTCSGCVKYNHSGSCSLGEDNQGQERDYVTYLENYLQRLKLSLSNDSPQQVGAHGSSPFHSPQVFQPHQSSIGKASGAQTGRKIDDLISEIGALPILPSSVIDLANEGPSLAAVALATAGCSKSLQSIISPGSSVNSYQAFKRNLPDKIFAHKLIHHYIKSLYPRIPFFSIQGLWTQVELAYATDPRIFQNWQAQIALGTVQDTPRASQLSPPDLQGGFPEATLVDRGYAFFTVLMVMSIATSSLSKSEDSIASHNGEELLHYALQFRDFALLPNTFVGVQAMLFLIQYATLNPSKLDAWYLIGVGMRLCIDLGLQNDPSDSVPSSILETRRRLFWSVYSFDRSMSLGIGRPCEVLDDVVFAELPEFRIDSSFTEDDIQTYKQRYKILHLQSLAYDRLYYPGSKLVNSQDIEAFSSKFDAWRVNNPKVTSERSAELLESEWLQARMILYRPCRALPTRDSEDLLRLWHSSLAFIGIYRKFVNRNEIFYVQVACEKVYAAGLNILHVYWKLSHQNNIHTGSVNVVDLWAGVADVNVMMGTLSSRWRNGESLAKRFEDISGVMLHLTGATPPSGILSWGSHTARAIGRNSGSDLEVPVEIVDLWKSTTLRRESARYSDTTESIGSSELQGEMRDLMVGLLTRS